MSSLYRTCRNRFVLYSSDGLGRDGYISYNNGGFWKPEQQVVAITNRYDHPVNKAFHSLHHMAAPFRYYSDGSGRDSYVLLNSGGLKKDFFPLSGFHLKDFLRTETNFSPSFRKNIKMSLGEKRVNSQLRKLEKGLVNRLYTQEMKKRKNKLCFTNAFSSSATQRIATSPKCDCQFPRYEKEAATRERLVTEGDLSNFKEKAKKIEKYELICKNASNNIKDSNHYYCQTFSNFGVNNRMSFDKINYHPQKIKLRKVIIKK